MLNDINLKKDELEITQKMKLFRVHNNEEWLEALQATQSMEKVPLLIRTPRCQLKKEQTVSRLVNILSLPEDV